MIQLRDYQANGIAQVRDHWARGVRSVLCVAPTGAGKGTMAAHMIAEAVAARRRVLYVVHLRDIAEDMLGRLQAQGVRVGMVLPGHRRDGKAPVQIFECVSFKQHERDARRDGLNPEQEEAADKARRREPQ